MTPATSTVEAAAAASRMRRRPPITPNPQGAIQLAAVLAACAVRDTYRGQSSSPPNRPDIVEAARRQHRRALEAVLLAFDRTIRCEARRYATIDSCGRHVEYEDALQTARLGLVDAVDRYDVERGSSGCVWFMVQRVKYRLQQDALHTKRMPRHEVSVDDWSKALPHKPHGDSLWDAECATPKFHKGGTATAESDFRSIWSDH